MTLKAKKPSADTIEGDAVEKPSAASSSDREPTMSAKNTVGISLGVSAGIITAVASAVISLAVASYSLYQSQDQTALGQQEATRAQVDALNMRLTALEGLVDDNKQAYDDARRDLDAKITEQVAALPTGVVVSDEAAKRLVELATRLSTLEDNLATLAELANGRDVSASIEDATDSTIDPKTDLTTDLKIDADSAKLLSRDVSQPIEAAQPAAILSQAALVAVSGLLADNMAGRPVSQWHDILQALVIKGGLDFDVDSLSDILARNPPSRADLLHNADMVIAAMADTLHSKDKDDSLLGQAGAKLGKLVNLRATDLAADSPAGQLAAFEAAVTTNDFDAALKVAQAWQGRDVPTLTEWQRVAKARYALDAAITQLVAAVLADMAEAG
ncbi:hypothetical protein [Candidatus Puniceispirillum sp.]|uniref:hypothetical protein n=1 Tax=Candidatus Puniceispirillum sp. TaxID=2026719 RepID=UPI003F69C229